MPITTFTADDDPFESTYPPTELNGTSLEVSPGTYATGAVDDFKLDELEWWNKDIDDQLWEYQGALEHYSYLDPGGVGLQTSEEDAQEYWESLIAGVEVNPNLPGGWDAYGDQYFTSFEDRYGGRVDFLKDYYGGEILEHQATLDLKLSHALGAYDLGKESAWDIMTHGNTQAQEMWNLDQSILEGQYHDYGTMWELTQKDIDRREIEANAGWDILAKGYEAERQQNVDKYTLMADNLAQQEIDISDLWTMSKANLDQLGIDAGEIWEIEKASYLRQQTEATDIWRMDEAEWLRQQDQARLTAGLTADEIERLGLEATSMWGLQASALEEAWGLSAGALQEVAGLSMEEILQKELDAAETWGLTQADIERRRVEAGELWFLGAQDIMRRRIEAEAVWGFQEDGLREAFDIEKESLDLRTQSAIREAQKGVSNAALAMGFASAPTGLEELLDDARIEYGITESASREALSRNIAGGELELEQFHAGLTQESLVSAEVLDQKYAALEQERIAGETGLNQYYDELKQERKEIELDLASQLTIGQAGLVSDLNIGAEALVQTHAALQSDLNMNTAQLTDTLARLDSSLDISEAKYNSDIATLAASVNMGAEELANKIDQYARDTEQGELIRDQKLAALVAEGLLNDEQLESLQNKISLNEEVGANNLSNLLAGLGHDFEAGFAEYQINTAATLDAIVRGELTLEHAISTNQITYDAAIDQLDITYEEAVELGIHLYDTGIGNQYSALQMEMWDLVERWTVEQESLLRSVILEAKGDAEDTTTVVDEGGAGLTGIPIIDEGLENLADPLADYFEGIGP